MGKRSVLESFPLAEPLYAIKLDLWIAEVYPTRPATHEEQWRGVDRVALVEGVPVTIAYQCDRRAATTGNIFVETCASTKAGRPGWALTCAADWLAYYVTPDHVLMFRPMRLREHLPVWSERFSERDLLNDGYTTRGVPVPIPEAITATEYVARLDHDDGCCLEDSDS